MSNGGDFFNWETAPRVAVTNAVSSALSPELLLYNSGKGNVSFKLTRSSVSDPPVRNSISSWVEASCFGKAPFTNGSNRKSKESRLFDWNAVSFALPFDNKNSKSHWLNITENKFKIKITLKFRIEKTEEKKFTNKKTI